MIILVTVCFGAPLKFCAQGECLTCLTGVPGSQRSWTQHEDSLISQPTEELLVLFGIVILFYFPFQGILGE